MPIEDSLFCIPVGVKNTYKSVKSVKSVEPLLQRCKNWIAKVLVVGWAGTAAITLPIATVLAMLNKQPELAVILAKVGGFGSLLTLGGIGLKKIWKPKLIK
jgi:hypothetical protein